MFGQEKPPIVALNHSDIVEKLSRDDAAVAIIDTVKLHQSAQEFLRGFPGQTLYAVKCNDHPAIIRELAYAGLTNFDVASLNEIRLIHSLLPGAQLHFMNPVKSREAIEVAYRNHDVKTFVVDCEAELRKIESIVSHDSEVVVPVRFATPENLSVMCLGGKFGATFEEAVSLLKKVAASGYQVGLTFHVGSQCEDPRAYEFCIEKAHEIVAAARVPLSVLDVGGGFPGGYSSAEPRLESFFSTIERTFGRLFDLEKTRLFCEPGRALVAAAQSTFVRVELRRERDLFLTDGVYGMLSELRYLENRLPVRAYRDGKLLGGECCPFRLLGPSCDNIDQMPGPFMLPSQISENDWIEVGMNGAYSNVYRTKFNGFFVDTFVELKSGSINRHQNLKQA